MIPTVYVPPQPSGRARELSASLAEAIREYRRRHPETRPDEVQQAIQLAAQETRTDSQSVVLAVAVLVGFVFLLLGLAFVFALT